MNLVSRSGSTRGRGSPKVAPRGSYRFVECGGHYPQVSSHFGVLWSDLSSVVIRLYVGCTTDLVLWTVATGPPWPLVTE